MNIKDLSGVRKSIMESTNFIISLSMIDDEDHEMSPSPISTHTCLIEVLIL